MDREPASGPARLTRRSILVGALGLVGATAACSGASPPTPDLEESLLAFTSAMDPEADYRPPTPGERRAAVAGLVRLAEDGPGGRDMSQWGFLTRLVSDRRGGAAYTLTASEPGAERAWGLYLLPRAGPPASIVEVPHPGSDLETEIVALAILRADPRCAVLEAGAHRRAADSAADVAHREDSLFHAFALALARRYRIPQVQLHGFDDDEDSPDSDVIVSAGSARVGPEVERIATRLEHADLDVCRSWESDCEDLEGRTNVQGIGCRDAGLVFVHLEMSRAVRDDPALRGVVARSVVESIRG